MICSDPTNPVSVEPRTFHLAGWRGETRHDVRCGHERVCRRRQGPPDDPDLVPSGRVRPGQGDIPLPHRQSRRSVARIQRRLPHPNHPRSSLPGNGTASCPPCGIITRAHSSSGDIAHKGACDSVGSRAHPPRIGSRSWGSICSSTVGLLASGQRQLLSKLRFVAVAVARPSRAREQKQSCRAPGRTRLDLGGSSSDAACLRRRSPAAVRANRQGRAYVVRRRTSRRTCISAPTADSSGTSSAFALTGSTSEGRERPFSSAPGAMRTRRESLGPAARDHSDSRDRPTKQ
jgi:hypothetical protein